MLCACGCGLPLVTRDWNRYYQPKFRLGHNGRTKAPEPSNPSGLCKCGCGTKTPLARKTSTMHGTYKGQPLDYCHGHNRRGHEFAADHCERISKAKVGVRKSLAHRKALSVALSKHPAITGPANYNWQGGVSAERRMSVDRQAWARRVKRRDGYACQRCGQRKRLHAHHIRPYATHPDLRLDDGNGLTLCHDCHWDAHRELRGLTPHVLGPPRPEDRTATR